MSYWEERFILLEKKVYKESEELIKELEKDIYQAQKELEKEINNWYARIAINNEVTYSEAKKLLKDKELKEFKWDVETYIKKAEENELNKKWVKELENASARVHISRLEQIKLQTQAIVEQLHSTRLNKIDAHLKNTYTESFYRTLYELQTGTGVGFDITAIDQKKLSKIMSKPWAADGKNFSDRIWGNRTQLLNELHTNMTRMCLLGESPDKTIDNVAKAMNVSKNQAARLVQTEDAYFSALAQKESYTEADLEEYQILATLDWKTSEICRDMDGKVFKVKDMQPGLNANPFHPRCRTTTIPYFNDEFTEGEKKWSRKDNGESELVEGNLTYKEWKEKYVKEDIQVQGQMQLFTDGLSNDKINDKDSQDTYMDMDLQYFSMNSKDYPTIHLDKDEYAHVISELNTHMTEEQRNKKIVRKAIGEYIYTVENNGFNDYRVIDKELIDSDFEEWWRD